MNTDSIREILDQQGESFEQFKKAQTVRLEALEKHIDGIELKNARAPLTSYGGGRVVPQFHESELKTLDKAMRYLVAGDQARADRAFAEVKGMQAGSGPDGGYFVHGAVSQKMTRVLTEISPVYKLARRIPLTTGDSWEEAIDADSAGASWVGELQSRTESAAPGIASFRVALNEICAMPKVSQKLLDVADFDVFGWLTQKISESFAAKESLAFHLGSGVGQPRGFLTYPTAATADSSRAWGTVQTIGTGASGAFPTASASVNQADPLIDVISALKPQYRMGAVWLMNRSTAGLCRKLKDLDGRHIWQDSLQLGAPSILLGFEVLISEDMPDIGAGSLSIALVNLEKAYVIVEQPGVKLLADAYSSKPSVLLFAYRRVGGALINSEAVKILQFS